MEREPTMRQFVLRLHRLHPGLKARARSTRYAVNHELVNDDQILHDGDEVGVLPAVTGG
jgi:molybdopterin converting factor small subunit